MASFIYYMPPSNPVDIEHLNPDQARERLVVKLGTFLIKERLAIESGCDFLPKKFIKQMLKDDIHQ